MAFYNSTKTVKFITEILTVNEIENHYTTDQKALPKYFVGYLSKFETLEGTQIVEKNL